MTPPAVYYLVMPSGEGLRVLTAAVYRGRLPGVSCLAACTTFAKPPEQRHSGDGPYPCCPRPNCRTPRLYHIEGCVSVCHRLPSARQRHRWHHRRRRRGARRGRRRLPQRHYPVVQWCCHFEAHLRLESTASGRLAAPMECLAQPCMIDPRS